MEMGEKGKWVGSRFLEQITKTKKKWEETRDQCGNTKIQDNKTQKTIVKQWNIKQQDKTKKKKTMIKPKSN